MTETIHVALVDDHVLNREGIALDDFGQNGRNLCLVSFAQTPIFESARAQWLGDTPLCDLKRQG